MKSWLVALRIARREARRAKGRTALVVLMIAAPVVALSFAAATYDMYRLTRPEQVTRQMGTASAVLSWDGDGPVSDPNGQDSAGTTPKQPRTTAALLAQLPPGSRATAYWQSGIGVYTATGVGQLSTYGFDATDPLTTGMVRVVSGRAPSAPGEIDASASALKRLGAHVGDTVHALPNSTSATSYPAGTYRIVGVVEVGGALQQYLLFTPGQRPDEHSWLVHTPGPVTVAMSERLGKLGIDAQSRYLVLHPPPLGTPGETISGFSTFGIGTLIIGLGLLEVVLLAGPAFAVGARRRQRELALVETAGGTPSTLRRIVLADGIVGGVLAAIFGVVGGLALAVAARPILEVHLTHERFGAYRVSPILLLAVAGLAVLTGLIGALVPAFTAGRQDVVEALNGRRGIAKSRVVWLVFGVAGIGLGAAIAFGGAYRHDSNIVLAGLVIGELGMVLCTPKLVGLVSRIGRFLPVAPRIALRDTARRRAAAAPAISAVMAAVAGSVALTVYLTGSQHQPQEFQPTIPVGSAYVQLTSRDPNTPDLTAAQTATQLASINTGLAKTLPGAKLVTVQAVDSARVGVIPQLPVALRCPFQADGPPLSKADQRTAAADPRCANYGSPPGNGLGPLVTADPAVVSAALGLNGADLSTATAALASGRAVIDSRFVAGGSVEMQFYTYKENDPNQPKPTTSEVRAVGVASTKTATLILPPSLATKLKLPVTTFGVIATPVTAVTQAQSDALNATASFNRQDYVYVQQGPTRPNNDIALILAIAAGAIALGAAAIATGLAAVDGRRDLQTLGAVGATPRVRRVLALSQSGVIAGLGSLLGAVAGLGAGAAVLYGLNRVGAERWPGPGPYPITVPWLNLAISVLIVPLVAMLGAGLLTRSRLPSERRAD
ncbi:MAG TPA: FtsX-like permease family protein [Micromonosporaceae bacterium]|jgi:putative ABC transport system permease protein